MASSANVGTVRTGRPRAPRKSAARSRELITVAARDLFGELGFTNTTVKDVAERAGVGETIVYRIFGTKTRLFEEAILGHLAVAIVEWLERWGDRPGAATTWESGRAYVSGVYEMVSSNRGQLLALLAAEAFEPAFTAEGRRSTSPVDSALQRVANLVEREMEFRGWRDVDSALTTRITFGMIFSLAMFPDNLLPKGSGRPSDERIVDEMTKFLIYGVSSRP